MTLWVVIQIMRVGRGHIQACKALKAFPRKEDAELFVHDAIAGRHGEENTGHIIICDVESDVVREN